MLSLDLRDLIDFKKQSNTNSINDYCGLYHFIDID